MARYTIWKCGQHGFKKGVIVGDFAVAAGYKTPELIVDALGLRLPIRIDQRKEIGRPALTSAQHSGHGATLFRNAARRRFEHEFRKPWRQRKLGHSGGHAQPIE